jgi:hypothetical protein
LRIALKGESGEDVDPELASLIREYQFRKTFSVSHEDYMNEPHNNVTWLLAIDRTFKEAQDG